MKCNVQRLLACLGISFLLTACDSDPADDGNGEAINGDEPASAWVLKKRMPTARLWHSCSVVNDKLFVTGGVGRDSRFLSSFEVYDPATDTWERKADMPTTGGYATAVGGKIYHIGGGDPGFFQVGVAGGTPTVEVYDPASDSWSPRSDMLQTTSAAGVSTVDGSIYVMGGVAPGGEILSTVQVYDPSSDTWTLRTEMPTRRHALSSCHVDRHIYAMGNGRGGAMVEAYDPFTDSWTEKGDMPQGNGYFAAVLLDGHVFTLGGSVPQVVGTEVTVKTYRKTMVYDPSSDGWSERMSMPQPSYGLCAGVIGGKIYVAGGGRGWPPSPNSDLYEYDPTLDLTGGS